MEGPGGPFRKKIAAATDPNVWAPRYEKVEVLRAPTGKVNDLEIAAVQAALTKALRASSKSVNQRLQRDMEFPSP